MATIDKDEIEKYIFDPDNPKACKSYKLLLNIAKKNAMVYIDSDFVRTELRKLILTSKFYETIWDKPSDFDALSMSEKIKIYINNNSQKEFDEYIDSLNFNQNSFVYSKIFNKFFDYTKHHFICQMKSYSVDLLKEKIINPSNPNFTNYQSYKSSYSFNKPYQGHKILFTNENTLLDKNNYFFDVSNVLVTSNKELFKKFFNATLHNNIKPLFLKKIEDVDLLLNVLENDLKGEQKSSEEVQKIGTLDSISIKNVFSIENIKLENLKDKKEIYIVGENGDGKTLLLQAIAIALKDTQEDGLQIFRERNNEFELEVITSDGVKYDSKGEHYTNLIAYGSSRNNSCNMKIDKSGYITLFKPDFDLYNPIKWLQYIDHSAKADKPTVISLEQAKSLIANLLSREIEIEIVPSMVADDGVEFREKGAPVTFDRLSAGYRSVIILICDLITRLSEKQSVEDISQFQGVVLIDEVELHLHPKWKYNFMKKLRETFPLIQFIVTTHSPTVILGASKEAVFYKVYKEEGEVKISNQITNEGYTHNSLISSPLFDLGTITSRNLDKNQISSDDYIYSKIHQVVSQRLKENININEEEILKLIGEELDKL